MRAGVPPRDRLRHATGLVDTTALTSRQRAAHVRSAADLDSVKALWDSQPGEHRQGHAEGSDMVLNGRIVHRRMYRPRAWMLACIAAGVLLNTTPAPASSAFRWGLSAPGTVDQSFTSVHNMGANINECCRYIAQTFTAGVSGVLTAVNVSVFGYEPNVSPRLRVAIHRVRNSVPTRTVLTSVALRSDSAPLDQFIAFRRPIPVIEGTRYAIVVSYDRAPRPGPGQGQGAWTGATGDLYPRGSFFASDDNGASWFASPPDGDLHFRTFVLH